MNLQKLCDHTVDLDLIPERPYVLDVGARNFGFTLAMLEIRPKAIVIAMDPDRNIKGRTDCMFWNMALAGNDKTKSNYASYSTGEGNMLLEGNQYYDAEIYEVPCIGIQQVMGVCRIPYWDVVKLDCEGSEFEILWNWPGAIATQISVEFHDGADPNKYDAHYFTLLRRRMAQQGYEFIQHERFKQGAWEGHWDSLLVHA